MNAVNLLRMFLPGDSPQLRGFFFSFLFPFFNVATLINSSSRCASIHENTITCSAFHLRASSERDKRTFGPMEPWAARNWPQSLGSEHRLTLQSALYLMCTNKCIQQGRMTYMNMNLPRDWI